MKYIEPPGNLLESAFEMVKELNKVSCLTSKTIFPNFMLVPDDPGKVDSPRVCLLPAIENLKFSSVELSVSLLNLYKKLKT